MSVTVFTTTDVLSNMAASIYKLTLEVCTKGMSAFWLDYIFRYDPLAEQPHCWIKTPLHLRLLHIEKGNTDYRLSVRSCSTCIFAQHYFVKRPVDMFDSDSSK